MKTTLETPKGWWMTDRRRPGRSVFLMCALGVLIATVLLGLWQLRCSFASPTDALALCTALRTSPPWTLLAGAVSLPGVALGWYWRTELRNEELDAAAEKSRSERFVQYASMIGEGGTATLGGIHGLVHLAGEDASRRALIRDTLCSFIRSRVGRDWDYETQHYDEHPSEPGLDIATAMEALSRLNAPGADLRAVDLERLSIDDVVLPAANLTEAVLIHAELPRANLKRAFEDS